MDRRVVIAWFALLGLCGCSVLFDLDALDPGDGGSRPSSPDGSIAHKPDANDLGDVGQSVDSDPSTLVDSTSSDAPDSSDLDDSPAWADAPGDATDTGIDGPWDADRRDATGDAPADSPPDAPSLPNMVPSSYTGKPFKTLTIPGTIYAADYDEGGAGVAYCHSAGVSGASACSNGIALSDWCCGSGTGCDERSMPSECPIYRADNDNAGLSHVNTGSPDDYAANGPTWAAAANGPTLTGPTIKAGTPVPQDANMTTPQDVYLGHMQTGEWEKYTVQVLQAGKYAVGGFMACPPTTTIALDFGNGVTTGTIAVPASPCTWSGCPSTFHSWEIVSDLATVTFPVAGTYLMTFTIVNNALNPNYFTFTKM
jgi:hypothetical protein